MAIVPYQIWKIVRPSEKILATPLIRKELQEFQSRLCNYETFSEATEVNEKASCHDLKGSQDL